MSFAPSGRFIYARYKTPEKLQLSLDAMIAESEISLCEVEIERITDHRGRLLFWAITIA